MLMCGTVYALEQHISILKYFLLLLPHLYIILQAHFLKAVLYFTNCNQYNQHRNEIDRSALYRINALFYGGT